MSARVIASAVAVSAIRGTEAKRFVLDQNPTKRARLVNELLERPDFADFWALKWMDLLRAEERIPDLRPGGTAFDGLYPIPTFEEVVDLVVGLVTERA